MKFPKPDLRQFILPAFMLMLAGLVWSRALLSLMHVSLALILFFFITRNRNILFQKPLIFWSLIPLLLFLSGLYQQPFNINNYDYLLTLLMYPIAALTAVMFIHNNENRFINLWLIAGAISLVYPIGWYLFNISEMNIAYGRGHSLPTFMDSDHVRYGIFLNSLLVVLISHKPIKPITRNIFTIGLLLVIIIMAVRTAWISAFIIITISAFSRNIDAHKIFRKLLLLFIPIIILSYLLLPTVRQKINYTIYDFQQYSISTSHANFSDGTRRAVNLAAWKSIHEHELGGEGWVSIPANLCTAFSKIFPKEDCAFKWPFNQWLYWWMGGGFISMLLFTLWLLYPLWWGIKNKNYLVICWTLVITASCFVESTLSLQYGVFLHAWPLATLLKKQQS